MPREDKQLSENLLILSVVVQYQDNYNEAVFITLLYSLAN